MSYILALDAGTGSVRSVLFDLNGNQVGITQVEWNHLSDTNYPGSMDFDYDKNWELVMGCIKALLKTTNVDPRDIKAISATSMREGFVLYDKADKKYGPVQMLTQARLRKLNLKIIGFRT